MRRIERKSSDGLRPMHAHRLWAWLITCLCLCNSLQSIAQQRRLHIAAASDMKYAMDSVVASYSIGHKDVSVIVTYGSSGKFFEQILNGAPFDLYFSADVSYPEKLVALGKTGQPARRYGTGRIVIWSKRIDPNVAGMRSLMDDRIGKIAIANPQHAPYGQRAVESMKYEGIYEDVKGRLVYGENISQAAHFLTTGAADAGIVALSLALSPAMKSHGKFFLIPETAHQPLEQAVVILKQAASNADARAFQDFVLSDGGQAILNYFGFSGTK